MVPTPIKECKGLQCGQGLVSTLGRTATKAKDFLGLGSPVSDEIRNARG